MSSLAYRLPMRPLGLSLPKANPPGSGPMNPDAGGNIMDKKPEPWGKDPDERLRPEGTQAEAPSNPLAPNPQKDAIKAQVEAEMKRVLRLSEEGRGREVRSMYSQDPSPANAAAYLSATGIDPTVFRNPDAYYNKRLADQQYEAAGAFNPTLNLSAAGDARNSQMGMAQLLQQRARGQDSAVARMLQVQGEQAAQSALANARANSAYNPGMAQMLGEQAANQSRAQAAQQGSIAALQEQAQAQDALGGLYNQMRGQDLQSSGMGAQLQLQAEQMRRQGQLAALGMRTDMSEAERQALLAREQLVSKFALGNQEINAANSRAAADRYWKLASGVAGGVAEGAARAAFS